MVRPSALAVFRLTKRAVISMISGKTSELAEFRNLWPDPTVEPQPITGSLGWRTALSA